MQSYGTNIPHKTRDLNQALKNNCFNVYLHSGSKVQRVFFVKSVKRQLKAYCTDGKWHIVNESDTLILK